MSKFSILVIIFLIVPVNLAFGQNIQGEWKTTDVIVFHDDMPYLGEDMPVRYKISFGEIQRIMAEPPNKLMIFVNASRPGQLIIELPRKIIDSKLDNGTDLRYRIFTSNIYPMPGGTRDGTFSVLEETADHRTLAINYPVGTANRILVWIQGTYVVPELNGFTFAILSISMIFMLAIAAQFRRKFRF